MKSKAFTFFFPSQLFWPQSKTNKRPKCDAIDRNNEQSFVFKATNKFKTKKILLKNWTLSILGNWNKQLEPALAAAVQNFGKRRGGTATLSIHFGVRKCFFYAKDG